MASSDRRKRSGPFVVTTPHLFDNGRVGWSVFEKNKHVSPIIELGPRPAKEQVVAVSIFNFKSTQTVVIVLERNGKLDVA